MDVIPSLKEMPVSFATLLCLKVTIQGAGTLILPQPRRCCLCLPYVAAQPRLPRLHFPAQPYLYSQICVLSYVF